MKTVKEILIIGAFWSGVLHSSPVFAQKAGMNLETQDLVIKKMERVLSAMDKSDAAWLSSQQRLADLLSERARHRFMLEVESQCDGCKGSKEDRLKAVSIYESLLKTVKLNEHGPILFQLAHLYEMAGQTDTAITLYQDIIRNAKKKKVAPVIVTKSRVGLGDLLFQKGRFSEAREQYQIALRDKSLDNRALTIYNLSWCEFNTDKLSAAIKVLEDLLKDPSQITRDTEEGSKYDAAFHTDILRDLGTFYSKRDITTRDIDSFERLSPAEKRKDLMLYFAKEADRIGQKKAAHEIFNRYLSDPTLTKEERIQASVQLAQVNYDRGQTSESIAQFAVAATDLQKAGCSDTSKCEEFQKTMKRYVTELHRSKKLKPDQDLLNAYITYQNTFPQDKEMTQRGAQVAMEMERYPVAMQFYRSISNSRSFNDKEREEARLQEVSAAEKSKNFELQRTAYTYYLKSSSNKEKSFEVRYQMAYLNYQEKKFAAAAADFEDLAKDKTGKPELRKKAADLSLDALAQIQDEETLEALAWDYAAIFTSARTEYEVIARKTLMNRVARVANNPASSKSDLKKALKGLDTRKIQTASASEKILFYNNMSIVASKLEEDQIYIEALQSLLTVPGLSAAQRESTLEKLTGYYEKKLEFRNAYTVALKLQNNKISEKEKEFRLGTLADLAGLNSANHYRRALAAGLKGDKALVIRSRLVLNSANPVKELRTQAGELKRKPPLLNETTLLVYARTGDSAGLKPVLTMKEMSRQSAPLFIKKQAFYQKMQSERNSVSSHQLNNSSDRQLQKSIAARVQLLNKADKLLSESLTLKDVTAQMMALYLVSSENERMVRDLASLPLPANLTPAEQKQYLGLLKGRSKPFLYKARMSQQKQQEVWNKSPALAATIKDYQMSRPEMKPLLARELNLLNEIPGKGPLKTALERALNERSLSSQDLFKARQSVSQDPLNRKEIENLKQMETKIGHPLMPAYLEARLSHLQRGNSL
ncbi:MAG: tetratricopeptide repeat protein [Bdellovibrio sp.]